MSGPDAFDGEIERLFARPPAMDDGEAFAERVTRRLNQGWRLRVGVLGAAGAVGGILAVREAIGSGLEGLGGLSQAANTAESAVTIDLGRSLDWLPMAGGLDLSASSLPLFWLVAGAMIGLAALVAVRASDAV